MQRIDRYILSQLMAVFGIAALVLVLVYWVNRAVLLFDELIADGQTARVVLEFTALALPSIVRIVLPIAAFVAALYAINRLTTDSELTVVQATGASPLRLARPVLLFGVLVAALLAVLVHVLGPMSVARLNAREAEVAQTATAQLLREGEFVSPLPGITLYIRDVSADGELRGVLLSDSRDAMAGSGPTRTYTAARAYLVRGEDWPRLVMLDGMVQRFSGEANRLIVTSFEALTFDLGLLMPAGDQGRRSSREYWTSDLLRAGPEVVAATGKSQGRLRAEAHERLAEPLLAPVAALIALGSLLQGQFSRFGVWRQVLVAVVLAVALKAVDTVAVQTVRDQPSLWLLTYAPAALGLAVAAFLLWLAGRPRRVERPAGAWAPGAPPPRSGASA